MKAFMILGAVLGFLIGSGFGLASHSPWPDTLWRSCAAALAAAVLTRWWSGIWLNSLRQVLEARQQSESAVANVKPKANI